MAQQDQALLDQLQSQYGNYGAGNNLIEDSIRNAASGNQKQLISEGLKLQQQAQPAMFNALNGMGNTSKDMNPLQQLSSAQNQASLAMQPYQMNQQLQNFYGTNVNNMIGRAQNAYQMNYGALKDLYGAQHSQLLDWQNMANANAATQLAQNQFGQGNEQWKWSQGIPSQYSYSGQGTGTPTVAGASSANYDKTMGIPGLEWVDDTNDPSSTSNNFYTPKY